MGADSSIHHKSPFQFPVTTQTSLSLSHGSLTGALITASHSFPHPSNQNSTHPSSHPILGFAHGTPPGKEPGTVLQTLDPLLGYFTTCGAQKEHGQLHHSTTQSAFIVFQLGYVFI